MARPQRRWWWQSHLFDNDGGKLLRAFERRRRLARLHDASPEAQRSHRASRSAEGDGRLCTCDVATKNSPQTKCLSQLSQFQSVSQLNGDGVKVRGWQSDSLEPAAFEHSWYLCYKALVEGWEQVRVTRMRSTCTPRTRDSRGIKTIGLYCTTTVSCGRAISTRNEPSFSISTGAFSYRPPPGSTPSGLLYM